MNTQLFHTVLPSLCLSTVINIKPKQSKASIIFCKTLRDLHSILRVKLLQWWWSSSVFFLKEENWCFPNVCKTVKTGLLVYWPAGLLASWSAGAVVSASVLQLPRLFSRCSGFAPIINTCLLCTMQLLYSVLVNSAYFHVWAICAIFIFTLHPPVYLALALETTV